MLKKLVFGLALVVVFGGLLTEAVKQHQANVQTQARQTASLQAKLNSALSQESALQAKLSAQAKADTLQFNADQQALCGFLKTHVNTRTVVLPSECRN